MIKASEGSDAMSLTKIVVVKRNKLILTGAAVLAAVVILIVIIALSRSKPDSNEAPDNTTGMGESEKIFTAGVYSSLISLGDTVFSIEIALDEDHINAVTINNTNEVVTTMYPLVEPSLEKIEEQLINGIPLDEIELNEGSRYTGTLLIDAIRVIMNDAVRNP